MKFSSCTILLLSSSSIASTAAAAASSVPCIPCINRQDVKIGVVHHGQLSTDGAYWGPMNDAIIQGATDMNINMVFNTTANEGLATQQDISLRMKELIEEYCGGVDPVNAILVSLPNMNIVQALQTCQANDVSIATFNAG